MVGCGEVWVDVGWCGWMQVGRGGYECIGDAKIVVQVLVSMISFKGDTLISEGLLEIKSR